jgi:hypothetical protein
MISEMGGNVAIHKLPGTVGHRGMMPEQLKKGLDRLNPEVAWTICQISVAAGC